jgi:nicotinate-nucleotide adenylyltransferase
VTLAILGGTFNPVHNGHMNIAAQVRSRYGYDRIVFVPANIPAHKPMDTEVGTAHRMKMLELAVAGCPHFVVDDCELRRGGTSYTIETVRELGRLYPIDGKPGLIIGDDLVEDLKTWREADLLMEMVDLIVAHRRSPAELAVGYPCRYIDNSLFPVSSSLIREKLRSGEEIGPEGRHMRNWLPPGVFDYIRRYDLYH